MLLGHIPMFSVFFSKFSKENHSRKLAISIKTKKEEFYPGKVPKRSKEKKKILLINLLFSRKGFWLAKHSTKI
jgi:hypothetical protein